MLKYFRIATPTEVVTNGALTIDQMYTLYADSGIILTLVVGVGCGSVCVDYFL